MDVGIRYGDGRWPDLKSTFLLRDAFFPVCSPALLEGMHPLRGPALDPLDCVVTHSLGVSRIVVSAQLPFSVRSQPPFRFICSRAEAIGATGHSSPCRPRLFVPGEKAP
jgi:DNA-binding transcriptional LysR family regulator